MSRQRRLRWGGPEPPPLRHPVRDTLLVYGALAVGIVLFGWATGGDVSRSVLVALAFFAAASAWSLVRLRQRLRRGRAEAPEPRERS